MGKFVVDDSDFDGHWYSPCRITIDLFDADAAKRVAEILHEALGKAQCGGDWSLDGRHVGHDLSNYTITVKRGEPK